MYDLNDNKDNQFNHLSEKFKNFQSTIIQNTVNFEIWHEYYLEFLEAFNAKFINFDYLTNAIYLRLAKVINFKTIEDEHSYREAIDYLNVFIELLRLKSDDPEINMNHIIDGFPR